MNNKFGVNLMVWSGTVGADERALLPTIREMGYDGVEVPIFAADAIDGPTLRAALTGADLACTASTALPAGMSLIDAGASERSITWLSEVIRTAGALGAPVLCGPLALPVGERRGRGYSGTEWDCCVHSLREAGKIARDEGVVLAFEPLNRFETFFLNTVADGVRLVQEVDLPSVGLLLDTFHMHIEEKSSPAAIELAAGAGVLRHFHASENDRGTVGTGQVHWPAVFAALAKVEYEGWIVVESFNVVIPDLAGATCVWRPLAESPHTLARDSLRFLQTHSNGR